MTICEVPGVSVSYILVFYLLYKSVLDPRFEAQHDKHRHIKVKLSYRILCYILPRVLQIPVDVGGSAGRRQYCAWSAYKVRHSAPESK
jgi:hypothetical protein